jgi:hypothetical protein
MNARSSVDAQPEISTVTQMTLKDFRIVLIIYFYTSNVNPDPLGKQTSPSKSGVVQVGSRIWFENYFLPMAIATTIVSGIMGR